MVFGQERIAAGRAIPKRLLAVSVAAFGILLLAGPLAGQAGASHFRGTDVSWVGTGGNNADFTVKSSFIRSGYTGTAPDGFPAIGDIISENIGPTAFDYGDATGTPTLQYRVDAINVAENFLIGTALEPGTTNDLTLSHLYDTPGPFRALISSCCNIGDLQNNPDGSYSVGADVDFSGDTQSPVTSVPPVVTVGNAGSQAFFVQASDPGGQTLRWRLATAAEACAGACADPQPPGLAINANTGQITWDTTGLTTRPLPSVGRDRGTQRCRQCGQLDPGHVPDPRRRPEPQQPAGLPQPIAT